MLRGAWISGDRVSNTTIDTALAEVGIVVLALDFCMPPEGPSQPSLTSATESAG